MEEKISVLVPVCNVDRYLRRCLDSLVNQEYKNIEVILVDDGSKDNSLSICNEYAKNDKRFKAFHQEEMGVSVARNRCLKESTGKYVIFLDSDDEADLKYVSKLYKTLIDNNLDIAQCCLLRIKDGIRQNELEVNDGVRIYSGLEMQYKTFDKDRYYSMVVCGKLFKRDLFDNLIFPVGRINEDHSLIYQLYFKSERVGLIDDYLYYYHYNGNSITEKKISSARLDGYFMLREKFNFYKRNNLQKLADMTANEYFGCMTSTLSVKNKDIIDADIYFKKAKKMYKEDRSNMLLKSNIALYKKFFIYLSFLSISFLRLYNKMLKFVLNRRKKHAK